MDFLDPKRKKSHRRRLMLGYLLMAVAVAMGTLILLFSAYGYDINRKTGDVIQNGTVFLDTQPAGASVSLNGQNQRDKTASRLVLPGGQQYTINLALDGYREWRRTFSLEGGKIERLVYPILLPTTLKPTESQLYAAAPGISSQSDDRRWLLVQQPGQFHVFDLYDLANPTSSPLTITIPATILPDSTKTTAMSVVDWAGDNHRVLLDRTYSDDKHEFIMLDTTSIASSLNINTTLTIEPTSVTLRDKKGDQIYVYDATGGIVRIGDLKNRTVSGAILSNVLAYKSYGQDIIAYITKTGADEGKVDVRIRENDKASYLLRSMNDGGGKYLLDIAEFDSTFYYVVGTSTDDAVFVYRDPLPALKGQSQTPLLVASVLRVSKPQFVSFSIGAHFIAAQSGANIIVYDIEGDRQFKVKLDHDIAPAYKINWMDGFHFAFTDKEHAVMLDFDGSNEQLLTPTLSNSGPYFSPDFKTTYSLAPSTTVTGRYAMTVTSLVKK